METAATAGQAVERSEHAIAEDLAIYTEVEQVVKGIENLAISLHHRQRVQVLEADLKALVA